MDGTAGSTVANEFVLVHGMWSTAATLSALQTRLESQGHRCHVPTLPYHGPGDPDPRLGRLSIGAYVDALEQYVDEAQLPSSAIYIGHSMGGLLVQLLAMRRPPAAIILLAPAPPAGILAINPKSLWSFLAILSRWGFWRKPHRLSRRRAERSAWNGLDPERSNTLYDAMVWESGRALAEIAFWFFERNPATRLDYSKLTMPALFVSAENDWLVPPSAVIAAANAYPSCSYANYADTGHWLIDDRVTPQLIEDIHRWIAENVAVTKNE